MYKYARHNATVNTRQAGSITWKNGERTERKRDQTELAKTDIHKNVITPKMPLFCENNLNFEIFWKILFLDFKILKSNFLRKKSFLSNRGHVESTVKSPIKNFTNKSTNFRGSEKSTPAKTDYRYIRYFEKKITFFNHRGLIESTLNIQIERLKNRLTNSRGSESATLAKIAILIIFFKFFS